MKGQEIEQIAEFLVKSRMEVSRMMLNTAGQRLSPV